MKLKVLDQELEVVIVRKRSNKNTYIRVKEDFKIYVTTNYFVSNHEIEKLLNDNIKSISKFLNRQIKRRESLESFSYLGKKYNLVYLNTDDIIIGNDTIFLNKEIDINNWLKKEAKKIFKEELDKIYPIFPYKIPYPNLTIRNMKTRWGVCNTKNKRITLNLELIKKDIKYLDYVIVHELSHLIHANHKQEFWNLVGEVIPNYKEIRKEMRDYE